MATAEPSGGLACHDGAQLVAIIRSASDTGGPEIVAAFIKFVWGHRNRTRGDEEEAEEGTVSAPLAGGPFITNLSATAGNGFLFFFLCFFFSLSAKDLAPYKVYRILTPPLVLRWIFAAISSVRTYKNISIKYLITVVNELKSIEFWRQAAAFRLRVDFASQSHKMDGRFT